MASIRIFRPWRRGDTNAVTADQSAAIVRDGVGNRFGFQRGVDLPREGFQAGPEVLAIDESAEAAVFLRNSRRGRLLGREIVGSPAAQPVPPVDCGRFRQWLQQCRLRKGGQATMRCSVGLPGAVSL